MIERDHQHEMTTFKVTPREDGTRIVELRCTSQQATPENPTPCAMQEQRVYRDETLVKMKIRLMGVWYHPFDLIRSLPLTVQECSVCGGDDQIPVCENCDGLGIEALGGGPIVAPDLRTVG